MENVVMNDVKVEIKLVMLKEMVKPALRDIPTYSPMMDDVKFYKVDRRTYAAFPYEVFGDKMCLNLRLDLPVKRTIALHEEVVRHDKEEEVFLLDGFFDVFAGVTAEKIYREEKVRHNNRVYHLVKHEYRIEDGKGILTLVLSCKQHGVKVEDYDMLVEALGYNEFVEDLEKKRKELVRTFAIRKIKRGQKFRVLQLNQEYKDMSFFKKLRANKSKYFNRDFNKILSAEYQFAEELIEIEGFGVNEVNELVEEYMI